MKLYKQNGDTYEGTPEELVKFTEALDLEVQYQVSESEPRNDIPVLQRPSRAKVCPVCMDSFYPNHGARKYCTKRCSRMAIANQQQEQYYKQRAKKSGNGFDSSPLQ